MQINFSKYQASGNDFIMIDNRAQQINLTIPQIQKLCDRHYGIGSDGLIQLTKSDRADFEMLFFNPDGSSGMFCGNGGRAIAQFAWDIKAVKQKVMSFSGADTIHFAQIKEDCFVGLSMRNVSVYNTYKDGTWIDTGTSHFVIQTKDLKKINLLVEGKKLRHNKRFNQYNGANIDFYKPKKKNEINIRTYERGVENETLSCGTGVVASALVYIIDNGFEPKKYSIKVNTTNDLLFVDCLVEGNKFNNILLTGKVQMVYKGQIDLEKL